MGVTVQNGFLPRSVMLLCIGAGLTLLGVQWYDWSNPTPNALADAIVQTPATAPSQTDIKAVTLNSNPLRQLSRFLPRQPFQLQPFRVGHLATIPFLTRQLPTAPSQTKQTSISQAQSPLTRPTVAIPFTTQVIVKLSQRQVFVYEGERITGQYPLAVGQKGWETPIGSFQVLHMWKHPKWKHPITGQVFPPGPDNPLGSRWIGFWSDGQTEIGFHGTNQEELIGQAVSHGCLRMYNRDVEALYQKVAQGTPIIVQH